MLHHLRRTATALAVALIGLGVVVWDPHAPAAMANSTAGGIARNSWILADLASQTAGAYQGTTTNIGGAPANVLTSPVRETPTTPVPANAGKSAGLKLKGRGWAGALLSVGGFLGLDLLLAGDGAPDPVDVLPGPVLDPTVPEGWTLPARREQMVTAPRNYDQIQWVEQTSPGVVRVNMARWVESGQVRTAVGVTVHCSGAGTWSPHRTVGINFGSNASGWTYPATATADCTQGGVANLDNRVAAVEFPAAGYWDGQSYVAWGAGGSWWYPEGHPQRPVQETDPDNQSHTVTAHIRCEGPGGAESFVTSSVSFTVGALRAGVVPTIPEVACPADQWATDATTDVTTETGGQVTTTPLSDATAGVSQQAREALPELATETHRGLELERDGTPCVLGSARCRGWVSDPAKDDVYTCKNNGVEVPLLRCVIYEDAFEPTGTVTDPTAPGAGSGAPADADARQCWPQGWGMLNPAEWVLRPIQCAFVPTRSAESLGRIRTAVDGTAPAVWGRSVGGLWDAVPAAAGCEGPSMRLDMFGLVLDARPFDACAEPMSTAAMWTRNIATVLVVVFGSLACVRALGSGFGWKPSAGGDA